MKIGLRQNREEGGSGFKQWLMKFYITTSIPYVNGAPHIGHALEMVQADAIARFHQQRGREVFFLTGTDEHGAKIIRAAEAAGKDLQDFVDEISQKFRDLKKALNLSWNDFIRTTDQKRHWPGAEAMWKALVTKGDIYKKTYKGLYCVGHEAFITEKDLTPMQDGRSVCRDHQKEPEIIEEENYFFRLSKYVGDIELRIKNNEFRILPEGRKNEVLALIKEGVEDISFSRPRKDLSWGISVPGDDSQTMYVWCDALVNYISALGFGGGNSAQFKKFWPADIHLIGKDILRFHALIWSAMLLSASLELPKALFVHGHITVDGQKMSKTIGNVVDPFEAVKKYGVDAIRFYLLREIPSGEDGDFSYEKLQERYNGDLANGLGNFAARVLTLGEKAGPIEANLKNDIDKEVDAAIKLARKNFEEKIGGFKLHEAIASVWDLIAFGDRYVNEKKPWQNLDRKVLFNLVTILDNLVSLLQPILPATADKIIGSISWEKGILKIKKGEVLFPRL